MSANDRFRVNAPDVSHEVIAGEAVIVNLNTGIYYSTAKTGAVIWSLLAEGISVEEVTDAVVQRYHADRRSVADSIQRLVGQLQDEGLIVPDAAVKTAGSASANPDGPSEETPPEFEEPVLHRYTDMEELLLLDPIHDVDETGWPKVSPDSA